MFCARQVKPKGEAGELNSCTFCLSANGSKSASLWTDRPWGHLGLLLGEEIALRGTNHTDPWEIRLTLLNLYLMEKLILILSFTKGFFAREDFCVFFFSFLCSHLVFGGLLQSKIFLHLADLHNTKFEFYIVVSSFLLAAFVSAFSLLLGYLSKESLC